MAWQAWPVLQLLVVGGVGGVVAPFMLIDNEVKLQRSGAECKVIPVAGCGLGVWVLLAGYLVGYWVFICSVWCVSDFVPVSSLKQDDVRGTLGQAPQFATDYSEWEHDMGAKQQRNGILAQ